MYLCNSFVTCTVENSAPWYLEITMNCSTSLSSYQATGYLKSRGAAKPFAPGKCKIEYCNTDANVNRM